MDVKIKLLAGQTPEQAEDQLYKALRAQRIGDAHGQDDSFIDPAMEHVADQMKQEYAHHFEMMLSDIFNEFDKEHE